MNRLSNLILFLLLITSILKSQTIENSINIGISYSMNFPKGKKTTSVQNIIIPSIFSNFTSCMSIKTFANYKLTSRSYIGLKYGFTDFRNWSNTSSDLFSNSYLYQHTGFFTTQYDIFKLKNNLSLFLQINPYINHTTLKLQHDFVGYISSDDSSTDFYTSNFGYGFESSIGIQYPINSFGGIKANYGINKGWSKSLFIDKSYYYTFCEAGIYIRLLKNKRFRYE